MAADTSKQTPAQIDTKAEKICFVIAPIGDESSPTRKRSDQILKHLIEPVAQQCGYKTMRSDQMPTPGLITTQIVEQILGAALVIADLTDRNPNVFYELALRHATGKPVVQIMSADQQLPFDVAAQRTIFVNHQDLDSVASAKGKLTEQIEAAEKGERSDNPITMAIDLKGLRGGGKSEAELIVSVLEGQAQTRAQLVQISERISALFTTLRVRGFSPTGEPEFLTPEGPFTKFLREWDREYLSRELVKKLGRRTTPPEPKKEKE